MTTTALTIPDLSRAQRLALLPPTERQQFFASLSETDAELLEHDWSFWGRPKQLAPIGDWSIWLLLAGRGFGKTASLSNWANLKANKRVTRGILAAPTAADIRDILVEGETGVLNVGHPSERPKYEPSKRRLTWPNGTVAVLVSADEPDRFRGLQAHWAVVDELAAWRHVEAFDMLLMGLRLGDNPQLGIATTPRPIPIIIQLVKDQQVIVIKGSSYENVANLAPTYINRTLARYEGTRLGRQELYAEILTDTPGALWKRDNIELHRVRQTPVLVRVIVAIDPAASNNENSSETGIIVAGVGKDGHGYVLDDKTLQGSPTEWATEAITAFHKYKADRIVAEVNNGGDMIETVIRSVDTNVAFKQVRASRNKQTRAEPVSALYEQGKVHHVGMFGQLEDQMCTWLPGEKSPDRMDALVWALTELIVPNIDEDDAPVTVIRMRTKL